jgi:hypothetical protein
VARGIFGFKRFMAFRSAGSFHPDLTREGGIKDEFFTPLHLHPKGPAEWLTPENQYSGAWDEAEV